MDQAFQQQFQAMQDLDAYCQHGRFEDMPLSNELLDVFGMESYQATTPGCLPSPNSSNSDVLGSVQQSPILPFLNTSTGAYDSQPSDGSLGADNDLLGPHLHQSQESYKNTGSNTSNSHPSTIQSFSNTRNDSSKPHEQQMEPSMTSSNSTNTGQYQTFTAPSEGALCISHNSFQSHAATVPSNGSFEQTAQIGRPMSTHMPIAPKVVNNTSSASVPANSQHSPTLRPQHFVRNPSHLRNQIHPELPQYSPFASTAIGNSTTGQVSHTMSSGHEFTNGQAPNASLSHMDYQNLQHLSNKPPFRRIASAQNQSRGSPVSQNYQPFQESSVRTSVTSNSGQNLWQAGQFSQPQYPDPQSMFQQQSNHSPYMGHHHISRSQGDSMVNCSPEQHLMQPSSLLETSYIGHDQTGLDFNGSSPVGVKREMSSPGSDYVASTPDFKSGMASPKLQKKRRAKQEPKHNNDNEMAIDPVALQTADLTDLGPTDRTNVVALIVAMHNTDNVEDNLGMQKTWDKVRKVKALRIREVCVELLNLTKQAQLQKGTPLGEKRPINLYASFEKRFDALCETLTFQKTVCKHLIEPPYSFGVVDDPQYATDRVKNNRRVNHQKAEAIRLGREHLGEKGQGKGKPMLKTKKRGQAQMEDSQDDEENSGDEPVSDGDADLSSHILGPKSGRRHKQSKPLFSSPGYESGYAENNAHTSKKTKRIDRSKYQPVGGSMVDNSLSESVNGNAPQAPLPQQVQNLQDPFGQGQFKNVYAPTQQPQMMLEHDRMLHGLATGQQRSTLNQRYEHGFANESGNVFYPDNSTGGSDSEGLGGSSYGLN